LIAISGFSWIAHRRPFRCVQANSYFAGDEADALYIVSRGTLRIMSGITVYEVVEAGGIVGEMAIVEEDKPRSASVISNSSAELIKIDQPTFREMVRDTPDFALMVMRVMARRLRIMNQRYRPQAARW
jgi:CRP/FNR family transcriptional regulator, cyclic AMP receptor protein